MSHEPGCNGELYRNLNSVSEQQSIGISWNGREQEYSNVYGMPGWLNMMKWKALPGCGKVSTAVQTRLRLHRSLSGRTQRTGEKMGTKRSVLVDGRGVPLSAVVSGANTHDTRLLTPTLKARRIEMKGNGNNLCLDAGYVGMKAEVTAQRLIPHIRPRSEEKRNGRGRKKPRRWVVERIFSWLNQYRKIGHRYEKLHVSHMGLLSLCCACIVWRQVIVIYG